MEVNCPNAGRGVSCLVRIDFVAGRIRSNVGVGKAYCNLVHQGCWWWNPNLPLMVSGVPSMVMSNNGCLLRSVVMLLTLIRTPQLRHCRRSSLFLLYGSRSDLPVERIFVSNVADSVWWSWSDVVLETTDWKVVEFSTGMAFFPVRRKTGFSTSWGYVPPQLRHFTLVPKFRGCCWPCSLSGWMLLLLWFCYFRFVKWLSFFCSLEVRCLGVGWLHRFTHFNKFFQGYNWIRLKLFVEVVASAAVLDYLRLWFPDHRVVNYAVREAYIRRV